MSALDALAQEYGYASVAALDEAVATAATERARDARLDALVRRDLADSCRALRMRLAATACATATPSVWIDVAMDAGNVRTGLDNADLARTVERAAGAMADSNPVRAAGVLADFCGLSVEEWAGRVEAETPAVSL